MVADLISRKLAVAFCGLICLALLLPGAADAKKRPARPKPTPPPPASEEAGSTSAPAASQATPPAGIEDVSERLWHYQTDAARGAVNRFADQADANGFVATAYGRVAEQEKSYGDAEARLRRASELLPDDPAPLVYLGEVYLRQRRQGDADNAFRRAADLARARGGADAAYYLGVAQQRLKQFDDAVATLQGASAPAPGLVAYQIGVTRAYQQSWQAASDALDQAIAADSGLAYAYYYRGLVSDKLGRKDRMANDMDRFLALAPNAPEADQARAILRAVHH